MNLKNVIISSFLFLCLLSFCIADIEVVSPKNNEVIYGEIGSAVKVSVKKNEYSGLYVDGSRISPGWFGPYSYDYKINYFGYHEVPVLAIGSDNKVFSTKARFTVLKTFDDIKKSPAKKEIELLASYGLLPGWDYSCCFVPEKAVTRKELARFIATSLGLKTNVNKHNILDVMPNDPDVYYIQAVVKNKILSVDEKGNFYPNGIVRRSDLMATFQKAYDWTVLKKKNYYFDDVNENFWAREAVYSAVYAGVIPDWWNVEKNFYPSEIITRQDFAALFARISVNTKLLGETLGDVSLSSASYNNKISTDNIDDAGVTTKFKVSSQNIIIDGKTVFGVYFNSNKASYRARVRKVDCDLTPLGRPANTSMSDDGTWGDLYKNDGVYSLFFIADESVATGSKTIEITVTDVYNNTYLESIILTASLPVVSPVVVANKTVLDEPEESVENRVTPSMREEVISVAVVPTMDRKEPVVSINVKEIEVVPTPEPQIVVTAPVVVKDKVCVVQPGDTLLKISRRITGTPYNWERIAAYNNIKVSTSNVNGEIYKHVNIFAGQKIIIPGDLLK